MKYKTALMRLNLVYHDRRPRMAVHMHQGQHSPGVHPYKSRSLHVLPTSQILTNRRGVRVLCCARQTVMDFYNPNPYHIT